MLSGARHALACLLVLAVFATTAVAQLPGASGGHAWLAAQVQPDGAVAGEQTSFATPLQVRAEVLHAISLRGSAPPALAALVLSEGEANAEYMARRIVSLKAAGSVVDAIAVQLGAAQRTDGGWTLGEPFASDATDTALAVHALAVAGRITPTAAATAFSYLDSAKMPTGGWGTNGSDNAYVTSLVLLAARAVGTAGDTTAAAARVRLLGLRTGGHFGAALENSVAYLALSSFAQDETVNGPVLDAIRAAQLPNGSWENDPFVTAVALRAIAAFDGAAASITGRILHGVTNSPIAGVTVTLSTTPPLSATTDTDGRFTISGARPGTYTLALVATGFGAFSTSIGLMAGQALDIGTLRLQPDPDTGAVVFGTVTRADSGLPVADALVTISVGGRTFSTVTAANGTYRIDGLLAGTAHLQVTRTGFRVLTSDRTIAAGAIYDESPRLYADTVAGSQLDLVVIDSETKAPIQGVAVTLGAPNVANGATNASGRIGFTGLVQGSGSLSLTAPGYFVVSGTATIAPNQTLFGTIAMPPTIPGTTARTLRGRVLDLITRAPIQGVYVSFWDLTTGTVTYTDAEGRFQYPGFRGGFFSITMVHGGYDFQTAVWAPENPPPDDLGDFLMRPDSIGSSLADLTISDIDRTAVTESASGVLGGVLEVKVKNAGVSPVMGAFQVRAFVDSDANGAFTPGTDFVLGQVLVSNTQLNPDALVTATIPVSGTVAFRNAPIHVWVDSGLSVIEADEANNVRSTAEYCRLCPSSSPMSPPGSTGYTIEPEFATNYSVVNLGPPPPGAEQVAGSPWVLDSWVLPKKGDACTIYFGAGSSSANSPILAAKIVRDEKGHIMGIERTTRVGSANGAGYSAFYYANTDLRLITSWNGTVNGAYVYKPEDVTPGKAVNCSSCGSSDFSVSWLTIPPGYPGAGKLKVLTWPFGYWHSGALVPDANGYLSLNGLARVPGISLQGRPHSFAFVPKNSPSISRDSVLVPEWNDGSISTYELDAAGDPIMSTRRVMLRGFSRASGSGFDPLSGDLILTKYGGNGNEQHTLAIRGFKRPQALSDLTTSRPVATVDAAGRVTSVAVRIGNAGPGTNDLAKVGVYAVRNGARAEMLAEASLAPLASGQYADMTIAVAVPAQVAGVMVIADSGQELLECSRTNNSATASIQALQGSIEVASDQESYAPTSVAEITLSVANPGVAVTGYAIQTAVIDANGVIITDLGRRTIDALGPGMSTSIKVNWTVPNALAGSYRVRATLQNLLNAPIGEALHEVEIIAVPAAPTLEVVASTNQASYGALDPFSVSARVTNLLVNGIQSGLRVQATVSGPSTVALLPAEHTVAQLAPQAQTTLTFNGSFAAAAPGQYSVRVVVTNGAGTVLGEHTALFLVDSTGNTGAEISGTLTATPNPVLGGSALQLNGVVTNGGNADIPALPVSFSVVNPATGVVLQSWQQSIAAPRAQPASVTQAWTVPAALPPGPYTAVLSISIGQVTRTLAQAPFVVQVPPISVTSTVVTDRSAYDIHEAVQISASVLNAVAGRPLTGVRVIERVVGPNAAVLQEVETAIADLPAGATANRSFTYLLGNAAPGSYSVQQRILDSGGAEISTATTSFVVRSSAESGLAVAGTLAVNPATVVAGATASFSAAIVNGGNADAAAVPVRVVIRDAAQGVVVQFETTLALGRAQPTPYAVNWAVPVSQLAGTYSATLTATFGSTVRTLAQTPVTVQVVLPVSVTSTVARDRATYDINESVQISARVVNAAAGRPLTGVRVVERVLGPGGAVVHEVEATIADLPSGATVDRNFTYPLGVAAPGSYSIQQRVLDSAGVEISTATTGFSVRSSAESGLAVTGTLTISPMPVVAGGTASFSATIANAGNADAPGVPVRVIVRDAAQAIVTQFDATLALGRSQPTLYAVSWAVPTSQAAGSYSAVLTATFGGIAHTLGQVSFTVQPPAQTAATIALALGPMKKVAVLVSCASSSTGTDIPDDPLCAAARRQALSALLAQLGIENAVTTSADEFRRLVRCGEYGTLWVSGGADKLKGTLALEIREAVRRGSSLIVDGRRDAGIAYFDSVLGVQVSGTHAGIAPSVSLEGEFGSGTRTALGDKHQVVAAVGTEVHGRFSNAAPAITSRAFGSGMGAFFAYDFVETLRTSATDLQLRALLATSLEFVRPETPAGDALAGSSLGLSALVANGSVAGDLRVEMSGGGLSASESMSLAGSGTRAVERQIRLPSTAGAQTYTARVFRIQGGASTEEDVDTLPITVVSGLTLKDSLATDLGALAVAAGGETTARGAAVSAIQAGWTKATQGDVDGAVAEYAKAYIELAKIVSVSTATLATRLARLVHEAGLRGCSTAALSCAAPWTPASYSVLVFGSASFSNGQTSGPIAVGGAATISSYGVASGLAGEAARLNVGGSLTFTGGSVGQNGTGVIRVTGTANVPVSVSRGQLHVGVPTENFPALKTWHETLANNIGALGGTSAVVTAGGTYTFTGSDPALNVFTIPGASLGSVRSMHFNVPDTSSVVLNITGTAATLTNGQSFWNGQSMQNTNRGARVLYNLPNVASLSVSSWAPQGSILAPNAAFSLSNGAVHGALVTNALSTSSTGFTCPGAFEGALPASVIPSP